MKFISNEQDIKIENNLQAIYFYASWVPFNKKMVSMIQKIEDKYKIPFLAVDVDFFKNQCKRFDVTSVPTIVVLKNGKEIKKINGLILMSAFKAVFNDICNNDTL